MNISEGFIKRPIATSLLMAAIVLFGLVAYRSLPVSDLPNVDFPTLLVTAQLPGASADVASSVATPLENQFSMIAGLSSMTSVNSSARPGRWSSTRSQSRRRRGRRAGGDYPSSRLLPQAYRYRRPSPGQSRRQPILYL